MAGLYDASNTLITRYTQATPAQDAIKVVNRLLDGQYHIQTIGTPAPVVRCRVLVTDNNAKNIIDDAHGTGAHLKITSGGSYWTGPIMDDGILSWQRRGKDNWEVEFTISVIEQGVA